MKLRFHPNTPAEFRYVTRLRGSALSAGHDLRVARFGLLERSDSRGGTTTRMVNVDGHKEYGVTIDPGDRLEVVFHLSVDMRTDELMDDAEPEPAMSLAAMILPRSGLGTKGLTLANGTGLIDADYSKPLRGVLVNTGLEPIRVSLWDRVAQLVFTLVYLPEFSVVDDLDDSGRGGFGSTGVA